MPFHEFALATVVSRFEDDFLLGKVLFCPEISACGTDAQQVRRQLADLARTIIEREPLWTLHRRQPAGPPEIRGIEVEEPRPSGQPGWLGPVPLRFDVVVWSHGAEAVIGWVPHLDVCVIAENLEDLDRRLPDEVRRALVRLRASPMSGSTPWLEKLLWLQRCRETTVATQRVLVEIRSPREIAEALRGVNPSEVLPHVADRVLPAGLEPAHEVDAVVETLADHVLNERPRSALLVGPPGVGKSAVFREFVRSLGRKGRQSRPCWVTSGSRLVAGMSGYGAWQQRCEVVLEEATRAGAILHLGNASELVEVGRSTGSGESIADFLQPALARGELVAVLEATPEQARVLERDHPRFFAALARVDVREPEPAAARRILRQVAGARAADDVLDLIDRLHRRFATYSAYPGRPLGFLRRLIDDAPSDGGPRPTDVTRAFSRETGLPLLFLEEGLSLDLEATRDWLGCRVMGQPRAVDVVVDLLATVKTGLARPGRPIASLLFIGPTGVGKTQMAKALAEFLYHSPDRMTRIDMSEYAEPLAVERLVGGIRGEGLLTAKVREQPFGVILLDEFEKAHPRFFDILLQVLGEGRLTDAAGRTADFRNAVVVMTSNLGSDSFGTRPPGFAGSPGDAAGHFTDAVRRFLRPELFNRIDRVVPFLPLAEDTVERIAARELELVRGRDGIRDRGIELVFEVGVAAAVARHGFDARYGARPIKRAADRLVVTPLAAAVNEQPGGGPARAVVGVSGAAESSGDVAPTTGVVPGTIDVTVRRAGPTGSGSESLSDLALIAGWCRRNGAALAGAYRIQRLRNDLLLATRYGRMAGGPPAAPAAGAWVEEKRGRTRQASLVETLGHVDAWHARSKELERRILRCYHGMGPLDSRITEELLDHSRSLRELLESVYARHAHPLNAVTIGLFGDHPASMRRLARAYLAVAAARGLAMEVHAVTAGNPPGPPVAEAARGLPMGADPADASRPDQATRRRLTASRLVAPQTFLARDADAAAGEADHPVIGLLLGASGFPAALLFAAEEGIHAWHESNDRIERCRVDVKPTQVAQYVAPPGVDRRSGITGVRSSREYRTGKREAMDQATKLRLPWSGSEADDARVASVFTEYHLLRTILRWLDG